MKKIIKRVRFAPSTTRWVCIQCTRQYSGAKPCPFCYSAIGALKASIASSDEQPEGTLS